MKRMLVCMAVLVLAIGWAAWADVDVEISAETTGATEIYQGAAGAFASVEEYINGETASLWKWFHISGDQFTEHKELSLADGCFFQLAEIGGPNWQFNDHGYWRIEDPSPIDTAFIFERICGTNLEIVKHVNSDGAYHLDETKQVTGEDLDIHKFVGWWTNTRAPEPGDLTELELHVGLSGPDATLNGDTVNLEFFLWNESENVALVTPDMLDLEGLLLDPSLFGDPGWSDGRIDFAELHGSIDGYGEFWENVAVNPDLRLP